MKLKEEFQFYAICDAPNKKILFKGAVTQQDIYAIASVFQKENPNMDIDIWGGFASEEEYEFFKNKEKYIEGIASMKVEEMKLVKKIITKNKIIENIELEKGDIVYIPVKNNLKESYNGWTNWETWNMALWADNEEKIYKDRVAMQKKIKSWDKNSIKKWFMKFYPKGSPDMDSPSELNKVNWQELADKFNDEEFD